MTSTALSDPTTLTFEQALAELETLVQRLESGNVPLEESIAAYERGETLKKRCADLLDVAEKRVEKIRVGGDGRAMGTEPLDPDA